MKTKSQGLPKTNAKSLVLFCMPLMQKGVGSAWGLPVVAAGKERLSALSLSEKLQAPGALAINSNPFRAAQVEELEALGIGPLGLYLGGEPIKPVRVGPEDFFYRKKPENNEVQSRRAQTAAELFCTALEFDDTRWVAEGSAVELFHSHLEFLRTWGFSGGLFVERAALTPLVAAYLDFLHKEISCEKSKIIVLMSKNFYEADLASVFQNAKPYGDTAAGEIPVNYTCEGKAVVGADFSGLAIVLYEDLAPMLLAQKSRCDMLITLRAEAEDPSQAFAAGALFARLKLAIDAVKPPKQNGKTEVKDLPPSAFLFRNLIPAKGAPAVLPFPAVRKTNTTAEWRNWKKRRVANSISREEAAALGLLSQWEEGRVEAAVGCLFAVNAKFSGLRAADFKEEQSQFYREAPHAKQKNNAPPPVGLRPRFTVLNETQLEFFLRWRGECRRGFVPVMANSENDRAYMESYILLYANELALCMGREGPLQHFHSLVCLFHACAGQLPETAAILLRLLVDFAVVYGITAEALPHLLDELWNNGGFANMRGENDEISDLLIDLAVCHFPQLFETEKAWPLISALIPSKIAARKENDAELPAQVCRTLGIIDARLRQDWNRGFFSLFYPPLPVQNDYNAFELDPSLGKSSYTVYRPGFSSHKPLIDILSALALEPENNPLPGVKARLHPLSLENELLEELRQESDAVRDILKTEVHDSFTDISDPFEGEGAEAPRRFSRAGNSGAGTYEPPKKLLPGITETAYIPPDKTALAEFIASLGEAEREVLKNIAQGSAQPVSDAAIDAINGAFYERFGDLLIETGLEGPSISEEYRDIEEDITQKH